MFSICCNELPIGQEEFDLRGDFNAQFVELSLYNSFTESNKYAMLGNSFNLIVGRNSDYESRILLKFDFPDSSYQGLDEIKLILKTNGDFNNDDLTFSLRLLDADFEEDKANWYFRTEEEGWQTPGGDFQADSLRLGETSEDSLVIMFNYIELEEIRSADGLIIIPENSGFTHFYSGEGGFPPQFILVKNDNVTSIPLEADCHIVTGHVPFFTENWIGSGLPHRNYVKFIFDSLLIDKKAVYAELTFEAEHYFVMRDTIEIGIKELLEPIDDFDTPAGPLIALEKFAVSDTVFSIDIVGHIQRIIEYPDSNHGFFMIFSPENYDVGNMKIVDHSHRLRVGYVSPPHGR